MSLEALNDIWMSLVVLLKLLVITAGVKTSYETVCLIIRRYALHVHTDVNTVATGTNGSS